MTLDRVADMPASDFHSLVSDPDVFVGGGSVAALTAAAAGSPALLVMRLNARRKSLQDRLPEIERALAATRDAISIFEEAADEDIRILAELLEAHRHWRSAGDDTRYVAALTSAAHSPLRIAAAIVELLAVIDNQLEISTRFTVSDLGAAAVLAGGACQAALLTAEVNIALLMEHPGVDRAAVLALEARRTELHIQATSQSHAIERHTQERLHQSPRKKGTS